MLSFQVRRREAAADESWREEKATGVRARLRLRAAFREEERRGLVIAATARSAIIAVLTIWLWFAPAGGHLYDLAVGAVFLALGLLQLVVYLRTRTLGWAPFAFVIADAAMLGLVIAVPNPFASTPLPAPIGLREAGLINAFILLVQVSFSFRPLLVLWAGGAVVAVAVGLLLWIERQPGVLRDPGWWQAPAWQEMPARYFDPMYVPVGKTLYETIVVAGVALGLALLVWRSRRLVADRAAAERARGNLARYFSPRMVDSLERRDEPMGHVRRQNVAVLFADIVGFTGLAETIAPEETMSLLRAFHARMETVVFEHGGALERLAGDSLMASFGVPDAGPRDGASALACARAMLVALDGWNAARSKAGYPPIAIGIGLHYGPAVLGDIGSRRSMAFTVIGDTVNLASRLQGMTRDLGTTLCVSEALMMRARTDGAAAEDLEGLVDRGELTVRGREQPVRVFALEPVAP
ncbi:MAG: adenylate/guanylate cyclase domain-containing protein [Alphaproteobacteria bacterium]|nr:adenylate/guanylate cyclase domain-containing protein [Alphaproteobacteria bacterium]